MLVDSHCHLNFKDFAEDFDAVIARAHAAGVEVMQTICTDLQEFDEVVGIAERHAGIYASVGVHPNDSGQVPDFTVHDLVSRAAHNKVIGIGETGLDYHYENSDRASQKASFAKHLEAAQETGLPIIVHSRDAEEDTAAMIAEFHVKKPVRGVIHCFTAGPYLAEKALEMGFYISISGIITFKNASDLREVVKNVPLERLLVETDAPYLAPLPYRGKRNEPAFTRQTNAFLASLKGVSEEQCAAATTDNFFALFSKAARPATLA